VTSLAEWVAARVPPAPTELLAHVARDVDGRGAGDASGDRGNALLDACDQALGRVLDASAPTRETALDLLSADAYVTYAFEAAADAPESIVGRADEAMRRISARAERWLPTTEDGR
jgi:hypothetical protein